MGVKKYAWAPCAVVLVALASFWQVAEYPILSSAKQLAIAGGSMHPVASAQAEPVVVPGAPIQFGAWSYVGPDGIAGEIIGLERDPVTGVMYAATKEGWIFGSSDSGGSWTPVSSLLSARNVRRFALERRAGGVGFYLATEPVGADNGSLYRLAVDGTVEVVNGHDTPYDVLVAGDRLYYATNWGVVTRDGGGNWTTTLPNVACSDLAQAGNHVFALCDFKVYRSINGGAFENVLALPYSSIQLSPQGALASSKSNPSVVYASFPVLADTSGNVVIYRTTDGGTSWSQRGATDGSPLDQGLLRDFEQICAGSSSVAEADYAFAVDPSDPDKVWIGRRELYRSDDGALTFGRASLDAGKASGTYSLPRGIHVIQFDGAYDGASNKTMYVATANGVYATTDARATVQTYPSTSCEAAGDPPAVAWVGLNEGLNSTDVTAADIRENGEALATFGSGDMGGLYYGDIEIPGPWIRMSGEAPTSILIDPVQGLDRFHTNRCGLASFCRWDWDAESASWIRSSAATGYTDSPYYATFARDPLNPARFWAGGLSSELFRSDDAAEHWSRAGSFPAWGPTYAIAVSPADPNLVITGGGQSGVSRTTNALTAGASTQWQYRSLISDGRQPYWNVRSITFEQADPRRVYITGNIEPGIFSSDDAGQSWTAIDRVGDFDGLPEVDSLSLAVDPDNGDILFVGAKPQSMVPGRGGGLYITSSRGRLTGERMPWSQVPAPFGNTGVSKVLIRKHADGSSRLYAFTRGRGIWMIPYRVQRFADVPSGSWAFDYIGRLAAAGITGGCATGPLRYCPTDPVLREQMAVFLLKVMHGGSYQPPPASGYFADVPAGYWAADWIEQLRIDGITTGCAANPARYCPADVVTRDQMAVLLLRAEHGIAYQPPAATGIFADVPADHWAAAWIEQLAREGITGGCSSSPAMYCPGNPVTREQMAVFLVKGFGL